MASFLPPDIHGDSATTEMRIAEETSLGRGVVVSYVALLASILAAVLLTPFLARAVGPERYGTWLLVSSVMSYVGLLDIGLRFGVTRYTARLEALAAFRELGEMLSSAFTAYVGMALLASVAIVGLAFSTQLWLRVPSASLDTARAVVVILGLNACLSLPLTLLTGMLRGYQRFAFLSGASVALTILTAVLTVIVIEAGGGLSALSAVTLAISMLRYAICWEYIRRQFPALRVVWRSPFRARDLLQYGGAAAIIFTSAQVVFASDAIVVGAVLTVPAVAIYGVAQRLIDGIAAVAYQGVDVLFPYLTRLDAQSQTQKLRELYLDAVAVSLAIVAPCTICILAFGPAILAVWAGPSYSAGFPVLVALSIALLVHMPGHVAGMVLLSMNRHRVLAFIATFDAIGNLVASVVLARAIGLVGVALGTTIMMVITSLIAIPIYAGYVLDIRPWPYVAKGMLPAMTASVLPSFAAYALHQFLPNTSSAVLIVDVSVTLAIAALSTWYIALNGKQRAIARTLVGRTFRVRSRGAGPLQGKAIAGQ
jgi:O-antigen/teichoic acid export membrane protein